jgi:hypothetical protein
MKKVFSSHSSLAHAWANQLQPEGRASNMFFKGPVIYSWGHHYEIARFVDAPNGQKVCFINSNGYSSSTGKHTTHVRRAIPSNILVFSVPFSVERSYSYSNYHFFKIENIGGILAAMLVECNNYIFDQMKARSKSYYFNLAAARYSDIEQICELFGRPVPARPENWEKARIKSEYLRDNAVEIANKKQQKAIEKQKELLTKWLRHEYNGQLYDIPVHLRVSNDGQLIETTKGAKVPMFEAVKLLVMLREGQDVKGYKIDGFTVIENNNEAVQIGCHKITWPIINQFFK